MSNAVDPAVPTLPPQLREALVSTLRNGKLELPLLPEVASRVISLTMDENCEMAQLSGLIQRDQSMTGNVLRLANSALYAPPTPIVSLQQALNRLGMKRVREIALVISCENRVFRVDGFDLTVRALFRHSIATASYAQEIARSRRWNVEEAFLCGLLADVGKPVLLQTLVDLKRSLDIEAPREAMEAAADEFHCGVGAELVKAWKLPARTAETILYHHDPDKAPTAAQTAMLTRLGSDFGHWLVGPKEVSEEMLRQHPLCVPLNIYPEELDRLLALRDKMKTAVESVA
jgi:putative nucleotidyltransferase with HDIG domain